VEVWQGRVFRWSLPTAGLRLALPPDGCLVVLGTAPIRPDAGVNLRVFVDGRQVPAHSVHTANGQITIAIPPGPRRGSESLLFWTCSPFAPRMRDRPDRRRLGLPLVSVGIQSIGDVPARVGLEQEAI